MIDEALNSLSVKELEDIYFETSGDFEEIPVDIETFVTNNEFIGSYFPNGFLPYWLDVLKEIYPSPMISNNYFLIILRGAIGRCKTTTACVGVLYDIYRTLCLRDPQETLGFTRKTKLINAMFNISLNASKDVGWTIISNMMTTSPYFKEQLALAPKGRDRTLLPKDVGFKVGSRLGHTLGQAVTNVILDEANFGIMKDQIYENFNSLLRRMESRFLLGKIWVTTSEKSSTSLVNTIMKQYEGNTGVYIDGNKLTNSASWHVWPKQYSKETFQVFIGTNEIQPRILDADVDETDFIEAYNDYIIEVPVLAYATDGSSKEVMPRFKADIYLALQDIAGVSTTSTYKLFKRVDRLTAAMYGQNIFPDIIKLDFFDDNDQVSNYILPGYANFFTEGPYKGKPISLHIDIGYAGDRCGIAATVLTGFEVMKIRDKNTFKDTDILVPKTRTLFSVGIENKGGQQVPLKRVMNFIRWLSSIGVMIAFVSFDGFQSVYMIQELTQEGFNVDKISVDVDSFHYMEFRDAIYRGAHTLSVNELLRRELTDLEVVDGYDSVDHPVGGSKDLSDAASGSHAGMLRNAHKYRAMFSNLFKKSAISDHPTPIQDMLGKYKEENPSSGFTDAEMEELWLLDAQCGTI